MALPSKNCLPPPPSPPLRNYLIFFFWWPLTVTATPQLMLNRKWYQASKPEMEFHMINMMYAALPMRATTTFSCKDDCILTKHTRRWTYSPLRLQYDLCRTSLTNSYLFGRLIRHIVACLPNFIFLRVERQIKVILFKEWIQQQLINLMITIQNLLINCRFWTEGKDACIMSCFRQVEDC